jgi:ribosomal protein S14
MRLFLHAYSNLKDMPTCGGAERQPDESTGIPDQQGGFASTTKMPMASNNAWKIQERQWFTTQNRFCPMTSRGRSGRCVNWHLSVTRLCFREALGDVRIPIDHLQVRHTPK